MKSNKAFFVIFLFLFFSLFQNTTVQAQSTPDPGLMGTYAVSKDTFDLGDLAYKPDSFPNKVELRGSVHYPTGLIGGPFPVIVLLHGRHSTVYKTSAPGTTGLSWPPPVGYQSITSFEGYDYFARTMASNGYIVISVSCNAINAADNALADRGMNARAQLMQKQLDLWKDYNTIGGVPFGTKFVGKLDMTRIGTMGHSRGGEGVIFHALLNQSLGSPYGIKAVITLAPVDFSRKVMNRIPLMNIAPYCDGDVVGLSGVHFYDDARYNDSADNTAKHSVLIMGANHNFFNTVWTPGSYIAGTSDDADGLFGSTTDPFCSSKKSGNGRIDTGKQKAAFNAYGAAFFRRYVGGDTVFTPILELDDIIPPASSLLDTTQVFVSYHAPKTKRKDINRSDTTNNLVINTIGANVSQLGLTSLAVCGGGLSMPLCNISTAATKEPHRGTTTQIGLGQTAIRWNDTADYYQNELPVAYQNITGYKSLMLRTAVNYKETKLNQHLDFTVQFIDSMGKVSSQRVNQYSAALFYQKGTATNYLPKAMFNSIKIPLTAFKGVNQTKLKYVRFLFNQLDSGSLLVSDMSLVGIDPNPCGQVHAQFSDSLGKAYFVQFKDSSYANIGDSLTWKWHFGDVASGVYNQSDSSNPSHVFSTSGAFYVCLYVAAYRSNGLVCTDTFCRTINLMPNSIQDLDLSYIKISPNPAQDFLNVSGLSTDAILELRNMCGQVVFHTSIAQSRVALPQTLPSGMYFATLITSQGSICQKLILMR